MIHAVSDETIMAFVDGELDTMQAKRVRDAIGADEDLYRKYAAFVCTREVLARAFETISATPIPDRLTRTVTKGAMRRRPS